ncbi:hypothetical protein CEP52_002631 [Fusarium oligoseptatum]|uniref:2EXR domain-containing protein n=1 Tax=Fusarium oligoseptatum TaxID=2604345 RepID=A0A428UCT4_9HYPO|nr:hypothetical protein CEP52_002631 [Fusarium oligoseptatum]
MTPSGQHLQLSNPKPKGEGIFSLFPRLPIEIRCLILEQELHHERFIRVELASHKAHPEYVRQLSPWVQSDENYLIISEWPAINKTLHVNAESRSYASRFYRVQLPCRYRYGRDGRVEEKGIFYFNPELDNLEIKGMQYFAKPESLPPVPEETDQELDQAPQPAIGFWLFPIEFLGPIPPVGPDPAVPYRGPWVYDKMDSSGRRSGRFRRNVDLSEYTPELCIFNLS